MPPAELGLVAFAVIVFAIPSDASAAALAPALAPPLDPTKATPGHQNPFLNASPPCFANGLLLCGPSGAMWPPHEWINYVGG